jgi:hypothetical protein
VDCDQVPVPQRTNGKDAGVVDLPAWPKREPPKVVN